MNTINSMGFTVYSDRLNNIILNNKKPALLTTLSPNSYGISTKDPLFREALINSDYLVLDGTYFALSSILLKGENIKKNQGPDVFYHFMERINKTGGKIFFLGSSPQTLNKIRTRATIEYPKLSVSAYSPPFKNEFSEDDTLKMIQAVNSFEPDILFIGITCPKQEKWAYKNRARINTSLICCIGAVFDWYAGNYKEIKRIWWTLRLGWLIRAIQRPETLKRNIPNWYIFIKDLFLALIRINKYY